MCVRGRLRSFVCIALIGLALCGGAFGEARRTALVIGNASYKALPVLKNPVNDANDLAAKLTTLGFEVIKVTDATQAEMENAVRQFGAKLAGSDAGLFYYSGHGVQSGGINYLVPVDADIRTEMDLKYKTVQADFILDYMNNAGSKLNIAILDACRDNPFAAFRTASRGLAVVSAPRGSVIVYATSPGSVAEDGTGRNGTFTAALLKHIGTAGLEMKQVFDNVGKEVQGATGGKQVPWVLSSYFGSFSFATAPAAPSSGSMVLKKTYGSIEIEVSTEGRVFLDGVDKGVITPGVVGAIPDVETGSHTVEVRYEDGQVEKNTLSVARDKASVASFTHVFQPPAVSVQPEPEPEPAVEEPEIAAVETSSTVSETALFSSLGSISLDWLPMGSTVSVDGFPVEKTVNPGGPFVIDSLEPKEYALVVNIPDAGEFNSYVTVAPDTASRLEEPVDFLLFGYTQSRDAAVAQLKATRTRKTIGWVTIGTGAIGTVGAIACYYLGANAYASYEAATTPETAAQYRTTVESYGNALLACIITGSIGLSVGPLLEFLGLSPQKIEARIQALDSRIQALSGGEAAQ
jgi:hypothetical protein